MSAKTIKEKYEKQDNGQFHNCQSWSFITVHGQF